MDTVQNADRTFLVALTATTGPVDGPSVLLSIPSGGALSISWPSSYGNAFNVLTNDDLVNGSWGSAGLVPYLDGDSYVITNTVGSEASLFYKLEGS